MSEFCRLHNLGEHVDGESCDGACLGSRNDYLAHVPIGMKKPLRFAGLQPLEPHVV